MQVVSAAFTAEERDSVRKIAQSTQVSWKKFSTLGSRTFTIGVSTIGGNDIIGVNPGAIGSPGNYKYFDESAYVTGMSWERGYNMPTGGLTKALAQVDFDNTSGRFTPRYMGGNSELYTAHPLRAPFIINAGFNFGTDITIPQFAGVITEQPEIDIRSKTMRIRGSDYIDFFQNRYLDQTIMFTAQRTDQVITTLFSNLGMNTAQYDLDYGINIIPFAMFEKGSKFSQVINDIVQAENGRLYQDEAGIFKFENRQHWDSSPYTQVQRVITTSQVINAEAPNEDHLINVVEVYSQEIKKQPAQIIFRLNPFSNLELARSTNTEILIEFEDPALSMVTPTSTGTESYFIANAQPDGTGTDLTSSVAVSRIDRFANIAKITFSNSSAQIAYITNLVITGRVAKRVGDIYTRAVDSSSVTAYEEHKLVIENPYIQDKIWAASYAEMIVQDFGELGNIQSITIRAIPELQPGDLISWQGRYWRVYDIKSRMGVEGGYIQDLTMLQKTIQSYFRIGISTIGGADKIAP